MDQTAKGAYMESIYLNTSFKPVLSFVGYFFLISHIEIVHTKTYTQKKVCDCKRYFLSRQHREYSKCSTVPEIWIQNS